MTQLLRLVGSQPPISGCGWTMINSNDGASCHHCHYCHQTAPVIVIMITRNISPLCSFCLKPIHQSGLICIRTQGNILSKNNIKIYLFRKEDNMIQRFLELKFLDILELRGAPRPSSQCHCLSMLVTIHHVSHNPSCGLFSRRRPRGCHGEIQICDFFIRIP